MPRKFTPSEFEPLALEACAQFDWAREDNEPVAEALAFYVGTKDHGYKIVGGHTRAGIETAIAHAMSYFHANFSAAAGHADNEASSAHLIPSNLLMITAIGEDGEPKDPSPELQTDLLRVAGHPVVVTVLGKPGQQSREFLIT